METEMRLALKERADTEAIRVFADNLRELLMAPRWAQANPGHRPGLSYRLPNWSASTARASSCTTTRSTSRFGKRRDREPARWPPWSAITASRPSPSATAPPAARPRPSSDAWDLPPPLPVVVVNESGASIYSASEAAREEFPGPRPHGAGRGFHRPPPDGPPLRAGQDRSQVHRRGPVPARRGPERAQARPWTTW
jgi:uncharacterized protein